MAARRPTHALFNIADRFLGEVTPDDLNRYPAAQLVALPATYWTPGYRWTWSGRAPVEDLAAVDAEQVAIVKAEAERRKMLVLSAGGAKKSIYPRKDREIEAWNGLATALVTSLAAFLKLPLAEQRRRFGFALADGARRGDPNPAAAIARFQAGAAASNPDVESLEAIEQAIVSAIRAATTADAKRRAAASVDWAWRY